MRLLTACLTMVLVGVALGRNIETNEAGKKDEAPLPSRVKTLESLPLYYRNQMRQKFIDSKKASNTAEYLKPIEIAPKKGDVISKAADAKRPEIVKQPTLDAQLLQKVDTVKIREPEIKENVNNKEPSKISEPQTAEDKTEFISNLKETIMAPDSEANVKIGAEPKSEEGIKEAKGIPAISSILEQSDAKEKDNLKSEPQGHREANLKENEQKDESVKVEKSKSKEKVKKEAKSKSSKAEEDKKNSEEIKNNRKSSEKKASLKVIKVDLEKNLAKIPTQTENLTKEKDSHKNMDKIYEKKKKEEHEDDDDDDSDDDDSDDDDSSDDEDD